MRELDVLADRDRIALDLHDHVIQQLFAVGLGLQASAPPTDPELKHFDLSDDKQNVIPVMKEILKINPKIKILGSPWSPPDPVRPAFV